MVTRYETGRQAEYRARDRLLEDGFHTVLRMAGSKGPVDLVAVSPRFVKFVQVKSVAKERPFNQELDELRAWSAPDNCWKELWIWIRERRLWVILQP